MTGATGNIYCGLHEFVDMGFLLHFLQPDDLFLDVGANIGSYTVLATAVCGAQAIAVEPDPTTMANLRKNVNCNNQQRRVDLVQAALGADSGTIRFTLGHDTMNRVANSDDMSAQEVALRTLDEVVGDRSPNLLKMDVEGFETEVVAGARRTLGKQSLKAIITESAAPAVRQTLEALGFEQYSYDPFSRQLKRGPTQSFPASANFIFIRDVDAVRRRISSAAKRKIAGIFV